MVKFRNGNSVEVLRREHDPCGSWFPGKITSVDGDYYVVRYKFLTDHEEEPVLEKVRGEDVRPQPLAETGKRWMVGDIAEVFDTQCWRVGKVTRLLRKNWFVVRLFGSVQLKEFHESNLRIRQAWHNNRWSVIGEVAGDKQCNTQNVSKSSSNLFYKAPLQEIGKDSHSREKGGPRCLEDGHDLSKKKYCPVRTINRSHAYLHETTSKDLVIGGSNKKRKSSPCIGTLPSSKQVIDVSSKVRVDDKFIGLSTNSLHNFSTPHYYDEDSNQCSVASCSSNDFAYSRGENFQKSVENLSNDSDAESSFPSLSGKKHTFPSPTHKLVVNIHELELRAYESTVQALYASGPLSWDQESLLTNLRLSLHISDEEHLLQLRHLLSSAQVV